MLCRGNGEECHVGPTPENEKEKLVSHCFNVVVVGSGVVDVITFLIH